MYFRACPSSSGGGERVDSWEALEARWASREEENSSCGWGEEGLLGEWEQAQETIRNITAVIKSPDLLAMDKII